MQQIDEEQEEAVDETIAENIVYEDIDIADETVLDAVDEDDTE